MPTSLSPHGDTFLEGVEGTELKAYKDSAGYLTIGTGHLITDLEKHTGNLVINGRAYRWLFGISQQVCDALLEQDVGWAERAIVAHVHTPLTQNQFDALTSFVFNVGAPHFETSTLLTDINAKQYSAVPAQLMRWINAGGVPVQGLVNRRKAEGALWSS